MIYLSRTRSDFKGSFQVRRVVKGWSRLLGGAAIRRGVQSITGAGWSRLGGTGSSLGRAEVNGNIEVPPSPVFCDSTRPCSFPALFLSPTMDFSSLRSSLVKLYKGLTSQCTSQEVSPTPSAASMRDSGIHTEEAIQSFPAAPSSGTTTP